MTLMKPIDCTEGATGPLLGVAACANVRTPCGPRRAENVRPGDLIVTRDNGLQPVRMVWTRKVTEADIAADPSLAPIRLKPRAIGPMMPQKDLLLAGSHRIFVPGYRLADVPDTEPRLIAARDVAEASDEAYLDKSVKEMTFFNIVFDAHQIFCANGLPVESYLPSQSTLCDIDEVLRKRLTEVLSINDDEPTYPTSRYVKAEVENYVPAFV